MTKYLDESERGFDGMSREGSRRSLKLRTTEVLIGLEQLRGLFGAQRLIARLPEMTAAASGDPAAEKHVARIRADLEAALSEESESAHLQKSALKMETLDGGVIEHVG